MLEKVANINSLGALRLSAVIILDVGFLFYSPSRSQQNKLILLRAAS